MSTHIQIRRDTAANWTSANLVLFAGELGLETDTGFVKIGDGSTHWVSLGYFVGATVPQIGTHAGRPTAAAANAQVIYYETDTGLTFISNGSTWNSIKPGGELGYAEITSTFSTASVYASFDVVTGLTTTVTVGARPIKIIFDASYYGNVTGGQSAVVGIFEDGSFLTAMNSSASPGKGVGGHREVRRSPAPGAHTYDIRLCALAGGTAEVGADAIGGTYGPAFLQVIEV